MFNATLNKWQITTPDDGTDTLNDIEILSDSETTIRLVGGDGYDTIQSAINDSLDGDIILRAPGTYDEDLVIPVGVTIRGPKVGVDGDGAGRDAADGVGEATIIGRSEITSGASVTIDGVRFLNDATTTGGVAGAPILQLTAQAAGGPSNVDDRAISLEVIGSGSVTVSDNLISGTSTGGFSTASWGRGLWFDGGGVEIIVTGNTFQSTRTGINADVAGGSDITISDNAFVDAGTSISGGLNAGGVLDGITDNDFTNVGTEFNFRNLTTDVVFDAEAAVDEFTSVGLDTAVVVLGGAGEDSLGGTPNSDVLDGNNLSASATDADVLDDKEGADLLQGKGGDDALIGGEGGDLLDGGAGTDTAVFADEIATTAIAAVADANLLIAGDQAGWTVTTANEGTDSLVGVEIVDGAEAGRILLVGNGGFASIQAAVNAAAEGDTILVASGSFAETVTINTANLTILGANAATVAHDSGALNGDRLPESVLTGTFVLGADANGTTISGFEITGAVDAIRAQSGGQALDNLTITNNYIHDTTDSPIRFGLGFGGGIGSDDWVLSGNLIDDINGNARTGMVLFNIDGLTVTDNVILHDDPAFNGRRGINSDGNINATIANNTISMGLVAPPTDAAAGTAAPFAIQISQSDRALDNVTVSDNTLSGARSGVVGLSQRSIDGLTITGNTITDVVNGVIVNGDGTSPVVPGVEMSNIIVTDNTITASIAAIFVRDLHDTTANGPVVFGALDVTGNTVNGGIVRLGGLDNAGTAIEGELLNINDTVTVEGSANNERVEVEGIGSVTFDGLGGNDSFVGAAGADSVDGRAGDDVIDAGAGDDSIDGGADIDKLVLGGNRIGYDALSFEGDIATGLTITGVDGTDVVANVEFLQFDNRLQTLDSVVNNEAPTDIEFVGSIAEDSAVGTEVATASVADASVASAFTDSVTLSLVDDAGGLFAIDATTGVVTVAGALDAETATTHSSEVLATSTDGSQTLETFAITVTDADEFDVTTPVDNDGDANTVTENAANGTPVGITACAEDEDLTNNIVSYS